MTDIASVLKAEISRLARKELRKEVASLKKAVASHRSEIADLKRRTEVLERALMRAGKERARPKLVEPEMPTSNLRFNANGFASLRQRLGLSAEDLGLLVGASSQSVYNWERGVRPRSAQLSVIAALRSSGKRAVAAKLESLRSHS
jgi:DNA-binding transcriptional regulator YiaG